MNKRIEFDADPLEMVKGIVSPKYKKKKPKESSGSIDKKSWAASDNFKYAFPEAAETLFWHCPEEKFLQIQ